MNRTKGINHKEDLKLIRKMMEESSRFLTLSGISGILSGIYAIIGTIFAWLLIKHNGISPVSGFVSALDEITIFIPLVLASLIILVFALGTSYVFARKEARKKKLRFWSPVTRKLLANLLIPLLAGGVFIIVLILNRDPEYIVPVMLIFYGLALINAGKFTFGEVQYLGGIEITTGLLAAVFPAYGLIFWVAGFGFLHILYGMVLHRKYN